MSSLSSFRSWFGVLALSSSVACGAQSSEICNQYLACVGATAPATLSESLNVYGRDGTCWKTLAANLCEQICRDTLTNLRKLPNVPSACQDPSASGPGGSQQNGGTTEDPAQPTFAWPFAPKTMYYGGPYTELPLGEIDPGSGMWGCHRDDAATNPPASIVRMQEPNDEPTAAISLPNPLPIDLPPSNIGAAYEICPDRQQPQRPDYDVFKVRLNTAARVIAELRYTVENGDLDLALFRVDTNPDTGKPTPTLITQDNSAVDNACLHSQLGAGTYYLVVRGAAQPGGERRKTAMNIYNIKAYVTTSGAANPCEKRS